MDDKSHKGLGQGHVKHLKFLGPATLAYMMEQGVSNFEYLKF